MEKNFKLFLFASVALGSLQLETLAMEAEFDLSKALKIRPGQKAKEFNQDEFQFQQALYLLYDNGQEKWLLSHHLSMANPTSIAIKTDDEDLKHLFSVPQIVTPSEFKLNHFFPSVSKEDKFSEIPKKGGQSECHISELTLTSGADKVTCKAPCVIGKILHEWKSPAFIENSTEHYTIGSITPYITINEYTYDIKEGKHKKKHPHKELSSMETFHQHIRKYSTKGTCLGEYTKERKWKSDKPSDDPQGWQGMCTRKSSDVTTHINGADRQNVVHTCVKRNKDVIKPENRDVEYEKKSSEHFDSPYIYCDEKNIYLTKYIKEEWWKDEQEFSAYLIIKTDHQLILNENALFSPTFSEGVYIKTAQTVSKDWRNECWEKLKNHSEDLEGKYTIKIHPSISSWVKGVPSLSQDTHSISKLAQLAALPVLDLSHATREQQDDFIRDAYPKLTNIVELSLSKIKRAESNWAHERLVSLSLTHCKLPQIAEDIKRLPNLTSLNLAYSQYDFLPVLITMHENNMLASFYHLNFSGQKIGQNGYQLVQYFHKLISLSLCDTSKTPTTLDFINGLSKANQSNNNTSVKILELSGNNLTDQDSIQISGMCPNLEELNLANNKITSVGVTTITERIPGLRKLDLSFNQIDEGGVNAITHLTQLIKGSLNNNKITPSEFRSLIKKFSWLTRELIDNNKNLENGILSLEAPLEIDSYIKLVPFLRGIAIKDIYAVNKDKALNDITNKMSHLESLFLSGAGGAQNPSLTLNDVQNILDKMKNLIELKLTKIKIDVEAADYLFKNAKNLTSLGLEEVTVGNEKLKDADLEVLATYLTNLRILNLSKQNIHNVCFPHENKIEYLDLSNNNVGVEGCKNLASYCPNLTFLNLDNNKSSLYRGVNDLTRLTNLTELNLANSWVGWWDTGHQSVAQLAKLEKLTLSHTYVTTIAKATVLTALPNLTYLDLSLNTLEAYRTALKPLFPRIIDENFKL